MPCASSPEKRIVPTLFYDHPACIIVLQESDLNKPFLYIVSTFDDVVAAGAFRGQYRQARINEFRRFFNRIDVIAKSHRFCFDPENAINKAATANTSE